MAMAVDCSGFWQRNVAVGESLIFARKMGLDLHQVWNLFATFLRVPFLVHWRSPQKVAST
jgi:hypothetical protein